MMDVNEKRSIFPDVYINDSEIEDQYGFMSIVRLNRNNKWYNVTVSMLFNGNLNRRDSLLRFINECYRVQLFAKEPDLTKDFNVIQLDNDQRSEQERLQEVEDKAFN